MEQLTIDGITYNVIQTKNANDVEANGHKNVARVMRENGIALDLTLQRPRGKKLYHAVQYAKSGTYSRPMAW